MELSRSVTWSPALGNRVSVTSKDCHCRGDQTNGRILRAACSGIRTKDAGLLTTPRGAADVSRRSSKHRGSAGGGSWRIRSVKAFCVLHRVRCKALQIGPWSGRMRTTQYKAGVLNTRSSVFDAYDQGRACIAPGLQPKAAATIRVG